MKSLNVRSILSVFVLAGAIGVVLFLSAGTVDYWQGWVYLFTFTIISLLITLYLIKNDPELLQRRMRAGPLAEKRPAQRVIMWFTSAAFLGLLIVPGLDRRFGWSSIPTYMVIGGNLMVVIGFFLISRVYRENTYTSATIEIAENQRVIDTGPYSLVRHPMYASALFYLLGTPIALGSLWGIVPFVLVIPFLVWRLIDEEKVLRQELSGYDQYRQRVKFRLLPGVW